MIKTLRSLALAAVALMAVAVFIVPAHAATQNYSVVEPVAVAPFFISGQRTTTATSVIKFALPYKAKLIGVSATARASGGTTPTLTVDVLKGGTTVLSAPITITAGTVGVATVSVSALADESVITVDSTIGGTNPTWDDITVLLTVVRL